MLQGFPCQQFLSSNSGTLKLSSYRMQCFIQALLLTSAFYEGFSFMAIGHTPSVLHTPYDHQHIGSCSWWLIWGTVSSLVGSSRNVAGSFGNFTDFKKPFHAWFVDLIFCFFRSLFACVRLSEVKLIKS